MRSTIFVSLFISVFLFASISIASQDIRIRFPKGRTSATMTGRVGAGGRVCYFANAKKGQSFNATLSSKSGKVAIFESGETSYSYVIEVPGDQSVCVDNLAGATTYNLTVSIR
ncbi:MAG: hypothetical protein ACJ72Z_13005 [Pyrinomonadaceae bacterium]